MPEPPDVEQIALTSADSFLIGGQRAFSVPGVPHLDPRTLQNRVIVLDGRIVRVVGVETNALVDVTGRSFALLVEPVTADA